MSQWPAGCTTTHMRLPYRDRAAAGRTLAASLAGFADVPDVIVLALPRGGLPVGAEVAKALKAPLDVFVVRKLGAPGQEELAMGAVASGGTRVLNEDVIAMLRIPASVIDAAAAKEMKEIERRERLYRQDRPAPDVRHRVVILVDDGLATGSTMRAAVRALRELAPRKIVIAAPVGAAQTCDDFRGEADEVICAATPEPFSSVGEWYEEFSQVTDEEVRVFLEDAHRFAATHHFIEGSP